jgi:hypothetical protein
MLGEAYAKRLPSGRFRAVEAYRMAERLDRASPEPSYRIAMLGLELGGADGERMAADGLARTLDRDPLYENAWRLWLTLFRNRDGRRAMLEQLEPHRGHPQVKGQLAFLLIEEERYAEADVLLDSALLTDSTNVLWLALRAQSAFEAGDGARGAWYYRRAYRNAEHDSTDVLWKHAIAIASPKEIEQWAAGIAPNQKAAWLERFWARRNPDLFAGVNDRIAEHFRRWRYARREYPLLHPMITFQRDAAARALNLEPSEGERFHHVRCEATETPAVDQVMALSSVRPRDATFLEAYAPGIDIRYRPMGGSLWWLRDSEREKIKQASDLAGVPPAMWGRMFDDPVFPLLGLDIRNVDSTAARIGYNLATGLSDRGLTYVRLGPPARRLLSAPNDLDPECFSTELEYWIYDRFGVLRFSKPVAFSEGMRTIPEVIYRPMELEQFETTKLALTVDVTSKPAPFEFGVWTAQFRNAVDPRTTDVVIVGTRGALAATLVGDSSSTGGVMQARAGVVTLSRQSPGSYTLLAHARGEGHLGRQRLTMAVRRFNARPALSDLLITRPWPGEVLERRHMIDHVQRTLTFAPGDTVRVYAEVYGLAADAGVTPYQVTYQLLKTGNVVEDYEKPEWPDALRFEFERSRPVDGTTPVVETLDLFPQWIPEGQYLLRLDVLDLVTNVTAQRASIAFEVKD